MHVLHIIQPIEVETTTKPEKLEGWTLKLLFVFLQRLKLEFSTSKQKKVQRQVLKYKMSKNMLALSKND